MKKRIKYIALIFAISVIFTSCEKWLDVNNDPNNITDGPAITEDIMLIGVEAEWAELAVVQHDSWYGGFAYWLLWHGIEGSVSGPFDINTSFGNDVWNSYSSSLKHAVQLYDKAKENGNKGYQGIAAVIAAWHWFYIADVYDKAPLGDAMQGLEVLKPTLASQEEIYLHANNLLDEAISLFQASDLGSRIPKSDDDYMLKGDLGKWTKLAYSIKARQAMRLIYVPSTTKVQQADLALTYLQNGMTSNDDLCAWQHIDELANASAVYGWMERAYSGGRGLTPVNQLIDIMNSYNDPRRYVMFTFSEADPTGFVGHREGAVVTPGNIPSHYKSTYLSKSYPDYIMLYSESLFLKAEAYAMKGDWVSSEAAMKDAIRADMEYKNIDANSIDTYLAQSSLDIPTNEEGAQELIIVQKYISNVFATYEAYFDFVRTGYPQFDFDYAIEFVYNTVTFPRRFPYPLSEIEKNPAVAAIGQPDWFAKGTTWDNK